MLTWEGAYRVIGWKAYQFPAPSHVLDSTLDMLNVRAYFGQPLHRGWPWRAKNQLPDERPRSPIYRSPLVIAQLVSGTRLVVGFSISILIGGMLGLLMWRWRGVDEFFGPLFLGMQTLPSVCWIPLAILTFGINESGILFVLVMGSCFAIAIALRDGLRTIPPVYQKAGLMLGAGGWRLYRYVLLPASLPAMTSSLRQGFSFAWRSLMGAELIFMVWNRGLGFLLHVGREFSDISQVIAVMAMMVIVGMIVDRWFFAALEKRVHARFGLQAAR
ncbi:MAG: ABC transporter permease [Phycisphaerales bacterium]|nr:ABC transporter permease [Phycisphaerales bacterium]